MVNGIDELAVTNVDGLDSLETIRVCTAYEVDGRRIDYVPADCEVLARCTPVYQEFPGWKTSTETITRWEDLPVNCRHYLLTLAQLTEARLTITSVGPAREQTMFL
jgi:adenylosuccinate synthase